VDWSNIRNEYIQGGISYRELAKKHDVPFGTLQRIAKKERWTDLRLQADDKAKTEIVKAVGKRKGKHSTNVLKVADKLLDKITDMLENMTTYDTQSIKHLTSALKDLKDIKGIKTKIDLREQEARIAKLEKEATDTEVEKNEVNIIIEGGDQEWRS
jgi:transposase-like protein